jgi:hypothetical protein
MYTHTHLGADAGRGVEHVVLLVEASIQQWMVERAMYPIEEGIVDEGCDDDLPRGGDPVAGGLDRQPGGYNRADERVLAKTK